MSGIASSAGASGGVPGSTGYLVSDLVGLALRQIGVGAMGTTPGQQDISDGVMHLNMLLAKWQQQRFMVPNLVDLPLMSTGKSVYYIGPSGDFDVLNRPARLESAYVRLASSPGFQASASADFEPVQFDDSDFNVGSDGLNGANGSGPLDFPLAIISSYEDYAAIGLKGLRTWPSAVYYSPAFPLGELRFFPIPVAGLWELHVIVKAQIATPVSATDPIALPDEYWDLLMWTLAVRLAPSYGQEVSPTVAAMAKAALQTVRSANTQIPKLQMPSSLGPRSTSAVNPWWIYTGGF
ncbi:hypothetical protein [Gluconacetobacter asukensis]|uniref:Uncharacterized protein n=1 Tax=Gluconacetobacter asukensis TaxID=1017181 RepID=A0A7W4P094_9PROT|nr:hypothetical protein [Gluconacetobacter asukensis]MBB2172871.1 hypothetical protein [Gluconacetobacter asukensis]